MGRCIIRVAPSVLADILTDGIFVDLQTTIRVINGIPKDAQLIRCWVEQDVPPDGQIVFLFEHDSWSGTAKGARYSELSPTLQYEYEHFDTLPMQGRIHFDTP